MDVEQIARLLELMKEHDLVEVEIEDPEAGRIRLRKAQPERSEHPVLTPTLAIPASSAPAPVAAASPATSASRPEETDAAGHANLVEVPSPMVGTFYSAASPESEAFVEVGRRIDEETVVCIIEAMKVMNEITPDVAGEVVSIEVENGEAVEYGQTLFLIRPA
jgi:acetyl-CoA carboxylase biotin carboxyl carrier protein